MAATLKQVQGDVKNIQNWASVAPPDFFNLMAGGELNYDNIRNQTDKRYGKLQSFVKALATKTDNGQAVVDDLLHSATKDDFIGKLDALMPNLIDEYHTELKRRFNTFSPEPNTEKNNPLGNKTVEDVFSQPEQPQTRGVGHPFQMLSGGPGGGGGLPEKPAKLEHKNLPEKPYIPKRYEYK